MSALSFSIARSAQFRFVALPSSSVSDASAMAAIEGPALRLRPALPVDRKALSFVAAPAYGLLSFVRDACLVVAMGLALAFAWVAVSPSVVHAATLEDGAGYTLTIERAGQWFDVDYDMTLEDCTAEAATITLAEFAPDVWLPVTAAQQRACLPL